MTSSILDHHLISERYFFPRYAPISDPVLVDVGDSVLACHAQHPHAGAPTLLHFHGNGEVVADYLPDFADALVTQGLNVFFAEYRGYGGSTGKPALASMLDDVEAIFQAVGAPEEQVVVYGRSVGSLYAIELASRHAGLRGLVIESGIADPLERVSLRVTAEELGVTDQMLEAAARERLDHQKKLAAFPGPMLVLHARHDHLVSVSHAERLSSWAQGPSELRIFENGDHNSILAFNGAEILEGVRTFAL